MRLKEERLQWKHDQASVDKRVDYIVELMKSEGSDPAAYMAIDMVYRPYLQWLHSAHTQGVNPTLARNSAIHVVNLMIVEIASRMNKSADGIERSMDWVHEFVSIVVDETERDLRHLIEWQCAHDTTPGGGT